MKLLNSLLFAFFFSFAFTQVSMNLRIRLTDTLEVDKYETKKITLRFKNSTCPQGIPELET